MLRSRARKILLALIASVLTSVIIYFGSSPYLFKPLPDDRLVHVSQTINSDRYSDSIQKTSAYLKVAAKKLSVPSISVSVGVDGEVVWSEALGLSDIDNNIRATTSTLYRTNGSAKSITAAALMKMVDRNMIDLDMQVNHLFPQIPDGNPDFTVRELLTHTAGIGYHNDFGLKTKFNSLFEYLQFNSVDESLELMDGYSLKYEPGKEYHYSTYGYIMISKVIEEVSGQSYYDFLNENVLKELNISSVIPDHYPVYDRDFQKIVSYKTTGGSSKVWPIFKIFTHDRNLSYNWAGGGMLATPTDMVKLGNAILTDPDFVSSSTYNEFTAPQKYRNGEYILNKEVALGWTVLTNYQMDLSEDEYTNVTLLRSGGVKHGSGNILLLIPEYNFVIDVAINGSGGNGGLWDEVLMLSKFFLTSIRYGYTNKTEQLPDNSVSISPSQG